MPLARTYDASRGKIVTTLHDGYLDRLSRWSDIQEYLPFLHEQARSRPGSGCWNWAPGRGNSTLAFLAGGDSESGGHVWSVGHRRRGALPGRDAARGRAARGGRSSAATTWTRPCRRSSPPRCDVLFLDTCHEYEHTLAELRAYMPRVAPGGVALFHDTNLIGWPGYDWRRGRARRSAGAGRLVRRRPGCHGRTCPATTALGVIRRDGEPAAARAARVRRARLGRPAAPRGVPAGVGEGRAAQARRNRRRHAR